MATSALAGASLLALVACTGDSAEPTTQPSQGSEGPARSGLTPVAIDLAGPVTALTATDAGLLLGTYAVAATPRAGLILLDPAAVTASAGRAGAGSLGEGSVSEGSVGAASAGRAGAGNEGSVGAGGGSAARPVSVTASTAYGKEGTWRALAADGTHVIGIAGERGGAHGNVRWTIWRGELSTSGGQVTEEKQEFWTFGGYDMGGLSGVGYGEGQPVVVGGWKSAGTGLDIATWRAQGRTWVRSDSSRTALASTKASGLVAATAVIPMGTSALLLGSTTLLGDGSVQVVPSIWTTTGSVIQSAWRRYDLPTGAASDASVVEAGGCTASACLLAGRIGDRLALWRWDGAAATSVPAPDVTLAEQDRIVGAGLVGDRPWLVIAAGPGPRAEGSASAAPAASASSAASGPASSGSSTEASSPAALASGGRLLHSSEPVNSGQPAWTVEAIPDGTTPTAAVAAAGRFWVATDAPALWASRLISGPPPVGLE